MGVPKVKAEALLLAALVLLSCFAASSSNCIPRRLLVVSPYQRPCNDMVKRPTPPAAAGVEGTKEALGSRTGKLPPSPTGIKRTTSAPKAPPGSNN